MTSKTIKEQIKNDLLEQLKEKNATQFHYCELVNDYLSMWEISKKLKMDIKKRGVSVKYNNGGGQSGYKKNDSVAELVKVNNQMLKILSELGLRGANLKVVETDEEL